MNQQPEVVYECAAFDVVRMPVMPAYRGGCLAIKHDDRLGCHLKNYRGDPKQPLYYEFMAGSVVGSAMRRFNDPIAAYELAKERGHQLHWINACGTSITAHKRERKVLTLVEVGQVVRFEGHFFEITKEPNDNLGLKPVECPIPGAM